MNKKSPLQIFLSPVLFLLSGLYFLGLQIDRFLKKSTRRKLPKPVLSIGNLTFGGTGKTPLLIKLLKDLSKQNYSIAVLTRGYKGLGASAGEALNDEALLLKKECPDVHVGLGPDRFQSATALLQKSNPSFFILDDGFQNWKLERDIDVVCIDATDPWGGGLFPLGRRREPLSGLVRASLIVLTRTELLTKDQTDELSEKISSIAKFVPIVKASSRFTLLNSLEGSIDIGSLNGKKVVAVSAIGNPQAFVKNLQSLGADVTAVNFPDHYSFQSEDLDRIENVARMLHGIVIVTEKDWMKLRTTRWSKQVPSSGLGILKMEMAMSLGDENIWQNLLKKFIEMGMGK